MLCEFKNRESVHHCQRILLAMSNVSALAVMTPGLVLLCAGCSKTPSRVDLVNFLLNSPFEGIRLSAPLRGVSTLDRPLSDYRTVSDAVQLRFSQSPKDPANRGTYRLT